MLPTLDEEVRNVKRWFVLTSVVAVMIAGAALLAGKDDIRRFLRMRNM